MFGRVTPCSVYMSCDVMSCHVLFPCHVMSCHILSCHVTHVLFPCHVMSCHAMFCFHVMSCHVIFLSCHVTPCSVYMSCHVISCHVISCLVLSCHDMSSRLITLNLIPLRCNLFKKSKCNCTWIHEKVSGLPKALWKGSHLNSSQSGLRTRPKFPDTSVVKSSNQDTKAHEPHFRRELRCFFLVPLLVTYSYKKVLG